MKLNKANEIFRTKYPTGEIFSHNYGCGYSDATMKNKVALCFSENSKVYTYSGSYEKVLTKLGFDVPKSQKQIEYEKHNQEVERQIQEGIFDFDDEFLFDDENDTSSNKVESKTEAIETAEKEVKNKKSVFPSQKTNEQNDKKNKNITIYNPTTKQHITRNFLKFELYECVHDGALQSQSKK